MVRKLHVDEADIDQTLVQRLIASQFPQWTKLPIKPIDSAGSSNVIYRLGDDMAVRLPRIQSIAEKIDKEHLWLPIFAPHLPLAIPEPIAMGMPGESYPWNWSIFNWIEGKAATIAQLTDPRGDAVNLANFITALQRLDSSDGPLPGTHNSFRGEPLINRDKETKDAIKALQKVIHTEKATAAWESALAIPEFQGPAVWIHGDLHADNLLVQNGKITAVIDFGCMGVGDPACDLMVAWTYLSFDTRDLFRRMLSVDEATWLRGRGWALSFGLIALPYYLNSNPILAGIGQRTIDAVLFDYESGK